MHLPFFASEGFANVFHHQRFMLHGSSQSLYLLLRLSLLIAGMNSLYILECLNQLDAFHVYLDAFYVYNFFLCLIFVGQGTHENYLSLNISRFTVVHTYNYMLLK